MAADIDAVAARLDILIEETRLLRADLAAVFARGRGPAGDDRVGVLLAAIFATIGDLGWTVRELLEHAALPMSSSLRSAVHSACNGDARALGRILQKAEGTLIDGLRIVRIGTERDGVIRQVRAVNAVRVAAPPP